MLQNIPYIHAIFDVLSYLIAFLISLKFLPEKHIEKYYKKDNKYLYYSFLIIGLVTGAFVFGTLNIYLTSQQLYIGKSVLGSIFGAVISVEIFKYFTNTKGSTGSYFVPSLAIGIAIGRIGCFLSGLTDYTHGIPTDFILSYDFGDGIERHPVQLYESALMFLFFIFTIYTYKTNKNKFEKYMFYYFIFFYASQRFLLEFIKPYKTLFLNMNLFQIICIILIIYSLYYMHEVKNEKK